MVLPEEGVTVAVTTGESALVGAVGVIATEEIVGAAMSDTCMTARSIEARGRKYFMFDGFGGYETLT